MQRRLIRPSPAINCLHSAPAAKVIGVQEEEEEEEEEEEDMGHRERPLRW